MKLSGFHIILAAIAICALGVFAIPRISFDFFPKTKEDTIQVSYSYPLAHPRKVEESVTAPIESALRLISGINDITSVSRRGSGTVEAQVDQGSSIDFVRYEIATKLRELYVHLPEGVSFPRITVNSDSYEELETTLMSYSMYAKEDRAKLYEYTQDQIAPQLAILDGIERVDVSGGNEQEWVVSYDEIKLQALGISTSDLRQIITNHLTNAQLSYHYNHGELLYLRALAGDVGDLTAVIVPIDDQQTVAIGELIDIQLTEAIARSHFRINGANSIRLNIVPTKGSNHLKLAADIKQRIDVIKETLPDRYRLQLEYDSTEYIRTELDKIADRSIWSLGILFLFVILAYRSWRDSVVIFVALIVNLCAASICYSLLEVQLNLYALAAVTISFGIIIDNAIVMAHHYRRNGNIAVLPAIISSTLTTIAALLVIFALPDDLRLELIDFTKVLIINLTLSVMICATVVPALVTMLYDEHHIATNHMISRNSINYQLNIRYRGLIRRIRRYKWIWITAIILLFGLPVHMIPTSWGDREWYNNTLGSDYYVEEIRPWVNRCLGGTLRLFSVYVYEGSSYRSPQETKLYVRGALPEGSTLDQMNNVIRKIETYLDQYSDQIDTYITRISSGQQGFLSINFKEGTSPSFPYTLKNRLQSYAIDLGGAEWNIYGVGKGFSNASGNNTPNFTVQLKGYNKDKLQDYSNKLGTLLLNHPRVNKVVEDANLNWWSKDKYQYTLSIDQQALASLPSYINLNNQLTAYNQERSLVMTTASGVPIKMRPKKIKDLWSFNNSYNAQDSIRFVLGSLGDIKKEKTANAIHKENQSYLQNLEFEYTGSYRFGQKHLDACLSIFEPQLPLGYTVEQQKYSFSSKKERVKYGLLALVMVVIFFICSIFFESLRTAALMILLIPLSFIGIFLIFYWVDAPFDQGGYVSFLLLSGIVVNALILIMAEYHQLLKAYPWRKRIDLFHRAFRMKSSPIFLTIISTALGLIPFLLHGQDEVFWYSLALGAIGGLIFSIIVIVLVVPLFIGRTNESAPTSVE